MPTNNPQFFFISLIMLTFLVLMQAINGTFFAILSLKLIGQ